MKRKCTESKLDLLIAAINEKKVIVKGRKPKVLCQMLEHINSMIGMDGLKDFVCDIFYFYAADLPCEQQFRNIAITGKPGCGKTEVSTRLARLVQYLIFNCTKDVVTLGRSDLIGQVLGETAIKTTNALTQNSNRCIFIDEVYSLGNNSPEKDIFSKECIDTLCAYLSDNLDSCCMIIAGYATATNDCFFGQNEGLRRRFPFTFELPLYTVDELVAIFKQKMHAFVVNGVDRLHDFFAESRRYNADYGAAEVVTFVNTLLLRHSESVCYGRSKRNVISVETVEGAITDGKRKPLVQWTGMYL